MGVSQSLGLGDKLREALADAQRVLDSMDLQAKVKIIPSAGGASGVDASMDRTEKNAKDAAEKTIVGGGDSGSGPLAPNDKLVDALTRLLKVMEGLPDQLSGKKGGRRRRGGGGAAGGGGGDDDSEHGSGYVNPYLLQGMMQDPISTGQSSLWSMLMGGNGTGLKPSGKLLKLLAGSSGELSVGKALGAETLTGAGGATSFLSTGAIAAAGVGALVAAFSKTMSMQQESADDRIKDAESYLEDRRRGSNLGVDWRKALWKNEFSSGGTRGNNGENWWIKDITQAASAADVGFGGLGDAGFAPAMQKVVNTGVNLGVDSGRMGSVVGAGVRSGTLSLQHGEGELVKYLSLIAEFTRQSAEHGFSSNESLQRIAEVSHRASQGTGGLVTRSSMISLLSMEERARHAMPEELQRTGAANGLEALGANPTSDTQRVMMMNQFLGGDGNLTAEGEAVAQKVLGPGQLALMKKHYGRFAGTAIAQQLTKTDLGKKVARAMSFRDLKRQGVGGAAAGLTMGSGDFLGDSEAMELADSPNFLEDIKKLDRVVDTDIKGKGGADSQELELAALGQQLQRLSGITAETAVTLRELKNSTTEVKREFTRTVDEIRMNTGSWVRGNGYNQPNR